MKIDHESDSVIATLRALAPLAPDAASAERVRLRCRIQLARYATAHGESVAMARLVQRRLAPLLVGVACVFYALALVTTALRLEGFLE